MNKKKYRILSIKVEETSVWDVKLQLWPVNCSSQYQSSVTCLFEIATKTVFVSRNFMKDIGASFFLFLFFKII